MHFFCYIWPMAITNRENIAYQGKVIEVVEETKEVGGKIVSFEFARRSPGVRIIIPTKDGKIILTRESRREIDGEDIRLPGGKVFDTLEEYNAFLKSGGDIAKAAEAAAIKEALEEVGVTVDDLDLFAISKCGTSVEWDLYYFVVKTYAVGQQHLEPEENITVVSTDIEDVQAMCLDGRIHEDRSALMLLRYLKS